MRCKQISDAKHNRCKTGKHMQRKPLICHWWTNPDQSNLKLEIQSKLVNTLFSKTVAHLWFWDVSVEEMSFWHCLKKMFFSNICDEELCNVLLVRRVVKLVLEPGSLKEGKLTPYLWFVGENVHPECVCVIYGFVIWTSILSSSQRGSSDGHTAVNSEWDNVVVVKECCRRSGLTSVLWTLFIRGTLLQAQL